MYIENFHIFAADKNTFFMKTDRPTVKVIIDTTKERKSDGKCPIYIQVTWKGARVKEKAGFLTEKEYKKRSYKTDKTIMRRIREIDRRIDELSSDGGFDPLSKVLRSPSLTPFRVISELCRVKRLSFRTCEGYMTTHRVLQSYFGEDYMLENLTLPMIQGFARTIRVSPSTMAFYLKDLKSVLGYAAERGYVKENVMENWKFKKDGYKDREKPRSRTTYEIKEYVKRWRSKKEECLGIWLSGYYFNGLSLVDLVSVDWGKVEERFIGDGSYYSFNIERKKTKEVAHVMTPVTELTKELLSFLQTKPWENHSYAYYSSYINSSLKRIDPTLTYYQCRHSFASLLVGSRTPLNTIAAMLGRSVTGLSTYIHRVTEEETLAAASKALIDEEVVVSMEDELAVFEELVD